jgi:hypothetical protein
MRWPVCAVVCFAALGGGSCSLVVHDLPLQCTQQSDCDALNSAHGLDLEHDCLVYQCRSDGRGCEKRAKDLDGDGFTPLACHAAPGADVDCDDSPESGANRHPMKSEDCDGVDNNCDGRIDEERILSVVREQQETLPGTITDLSATQLSDGRGLAIASVQRAASTTPNTLLREIWAVILDPDGPPPVAKLVTADGFEGKNCGPGAALGSSAKCVFSDATATASRDVLFTAAIESAGCSGSGRVLFGMEPSAAVNESPSLWRWSQASSTRGPLAVEPEAAACEPGTGVALASAFHTSDAPSALAAWWNPDDSALALAGLTSRGDTLLVNSRPRSATASAATVEQAPALAALPGEPTSYLLAYASDDGLTCSGIAVLRVTINASGSPVPQEVACLGAAGASRPVLAAASPQETAEGNGLALAWVDGDGAVLFSTLRVEGGEALTTQKPRLVTRAVAPAALSAAWIAEGESLASGRWLVTWTDTCEAGSCLYGALFARDNAPLSSAPFRIVDVAGTGRLLTVVQRSHRGLALVRAESRSLRIGFLGCTDREP